MALREEVILDIRAALNQLDELQRQLSGFSTPITIPVDVRGEEALADLRRQAEAADTTVDIDVDTFGLEQADETFAELNQEIEQTQTELSQAQTRADALRRELGDVGQTGSGAFGQLRSSLGPLIATLAAGIGIREVVDQFRQAIDAAIALNESVNAVTRIFGEGADTILDFGENAAQSVGLARSEFQQLTVPLGALLSSFDLDGRAAADAAIELTERAADLASVFNTDVRDAVEAVSASLRGEQEPIRRYGVTLNQAAIDAKALELGLVGAGEQASQAARGQAAYALILEQTASSAGDFAATADEAANRQRILTAEFEDARAAVGAALLPVFEDLLGVVSDLIPTFENLAPAVGLAASQLGTFAADAAVVLDVLGGIASVAGTVAGGASGLGGFASTLDDIALSALNPLAPLSALGDSIDDLFAEFRTGITSGELTAVLDTLTENLEDGVAPTHALRDAFEDLTEEGLVTADALDELLDASGLEGQELEDFVRNLVVNARELGLSAPQIRILEGALSELSSINFGGALVGFDELAGNVDRAALGLDDFRQSFDNAFSQTEADRVLRDTFEDLPVIVSDLGELQAAAAEAGQSVTDFLLNVPENVTINVDPAVESIGRLLDTLAEVSAVLEETTTAGFGDIEIPELEFDATGAVTNLDEVVDEILSQLGETAAFEANLSELIVDADAVDVAALLTTLDAEVAGALAEAFVLDDSQASELQAALDGSLEGLAPGAAEQLAATLEGAVPEQIAALGVFAADNFVSNQIRGQIAGAADEIARVLESALDGTVISPSIILDLTNVQLQGVIDTGSVGIGDGFGDQPGGGGGSTGGGRGGGGGVQPTANFEVNINNATTQNVETSATQAAQTIQAVASSLVQVE